MKIVQLCPYAMDRPGGVQRHVRDLSAWLWAQGHETRILAPPAPGMRPRREGCLIEVGMSRALNVHGTGFEISWVSARQRRIQARDLRAWGAELVHLHTPWTPMAVWQMWRALDLPAIATVHATLPETDAAGPIDRYIRWAARRILPKMRAVIVPSEAPLPLIRRVVPGIEPRVLPPSVDLSPFRDAAADQAHHDGLHLVFLGRLEPRKGVDVLLKAWPRIASVLPEARLTIAGDGPMRPQVESAVDGRLTYAGRPDDIAARTLMASADIFLAPASYGESFGLVLVEAMSAGALPLAAGNPGYASVLTGDGAHLLVPPGDAEALATRVVALARDPARRAEMAVWARAEAARYDIARTGPDYLTLYKSVLSGEG